MKAVAYLLLSDGTKFQSPSGGGHQGADLVTFGEVVFVTSMSGYQELITDPASLGQILVMTYPLIGNYGVNELDEESDSIKCAGLIVSELCEAPCNWKSTQTLGAYFARQSVKVASGMDTRAITRYIAKHGAMRGMITEAEPGEADAAELAAWTLDDPVKKVTCVHKYTIPGAGRRIAVLDLGMRRSVIAGLVRYGCHITVYPAGTGAEEIMQAKPDGVLLTGGPGSPDQDAGLIKTARTLCEHLPVLGVGLGMLLIARAYGAQAYKLAYGHHGSNCPVKDLKRGSCLITLQSDMYAVSKENLPDCVCVTHENLGDRTVAGIRVKGAQALGVNYHPESGATLRGVRTVYDRFFGMMGGNEHA